MKLTTKSEYSLLALIYLARNYQVDKFIKIEEICRKYGVTKKYLENLFCILKNHKIITAKTGAYGGYRLLKSPNKISLAEIIRAMDGPLAPTRSVSVNFYLMTPLSQERTLIKTFREVQKMVANKLEKINLSDCI